MSPPDIGSMSNDNTSPLPNDHEAVQQRLLEQITEGMEVVDVDGDRVGKVTTIKMGDPNAASLSPADTDLPGADDDLFAVWLRPGRDLPEAVYHRMMHEGFVVIDRGGIFKSPGYALSSTIASVDSDTVRLSCGKDGLITD